MATNQQHQAQPVELGRPHVQLYGANGNALDLTQGEAGDTNPFDSNGIAFIKAFLAKYAVDIALLFLILSSGAGTVFSSVRAGSQLAAGNAAGWLITPVLIGFGLVIECAAAWSWSRRGTTRLVGKMIRTNDQIFKWSVFAMLGTMILSVSAIVVQALADGGVYWMYVEASIAIRIFFLLYRIKGEHPGVQADQIAATARARNKADWIIDQTEKTRLTLDERAYARDRRRLDSRTRHAEGMGVLTSKKYLRTIKHIMQGKILEELVPEADKWRGRIGWRPNIKLLGSGKKESKSSEK